jgi:hypothetical protein
LRVLALRRDAFGCSQRSTQYVVQLPGLGSAYLELIGLIGLIALIALIA